MKISKIQYCSEKNLNKNLITIAGKTTKYCETLSKNVILQHHEISNRCFSMGSRGSSTWIATFTTTKWSTINKKSCLQYGLPLCIENVLLTIEIHLKIFYWGRLGYHTWEAFWTKKLNSCTNMGWLHHFSLVCSTYSDVTTRLLQDSAHLHKLNCVQPSSNFLDLSKNILNE